MAGKAGWKLTALQLGAVPLLSALLGYGAGVLTAQREQGTYERRLYLEQRTSYYQARDAARDRLWADLDQAQLLFGDEVVKKVDEFRAFYGEHRLGTVETLPAKLEYVRRKYAILVAMRDVIKGGKQ